MTPANPLPLVTPITSMSSFSLKTLSTLISFSKKDWAKLTLSPMVLPPLIWISKILFFFCLRCFIRLCWVWHMALTTVQYFLILLSWTQILFLSLFSDWYLVKAFCLDLTQFLQNLLRVFLSRWLAHTVERALSPRGVSTQPTNPTTLRGGVSRTVTASTFSFLSSLDLALSTSLRMWVMPALKPPKAVKWGALVALSLGKDLILPLWCFVLFLGRKPRFPFRGQLNFLCDIWQNYIDLIYSIYFHC